VKFESLNCSESREGEAAIFGGAIEFDSVDGTESPTELYLLAKEVVVRCQASVLSIERSDLCYE